MATYKQAYILGDMLYKGSQLLRAQEVEQLREIGIPLYSAAEQNKDGDINDKKNQTKESNADLHAHIFKKDMDNIYASDLIIANPERFAEGSIAELGAVETFNDIHSTMDDIVNDPSYDTVVGYVQSHPGVRFDEAYKLINFDRLANSKGTAAKQAAINEIKGKNHLSTGAAVNINSTAEDIPESLLETYKESFPGRSLKELKALYNKAKKSQKG